LLIVFLTVFAGIYAGEMGDKLMYIANHKLDLSIYAQFSRGILCNILVSTAVLMSFYAGNITAKILACIFPVSLFIIGGFEHIVANMYIIPGAYMISLYKSDITNTFSGVAVIQSFLAVLMGNTFGGMIVSIFVFYKYKNADERKFNT
jgi:formate/nitrite transporter FocA (FNT family)